MFLFFYFHHFNVPDNKRQKEKYYVLFFTCITVFFLVVRGIGEGGSEILLGGYWVKVTWVTGWRWAEKEWFWQFEPFSKLKTTFCDYWTLIKIKINMTYVSNEYENKTKMQQEQWLQLKMLCLLGYNMKIVIL